MKLTDRQREANKVLSGDATHTMLVGGSRSGKTALLVRNIILRAIKAPESRHAILRYRFNHCMASIVLDTWPKVLQLAAPEIAPLVRIDKRDWYAQMPNGSQVWFGGIDDRERTEKILGQEHATIYLNEISQIPQSSRDMAVTRLAQLVMQDTPGLGKRPLKPRMYYDCNPPSKSHWSYKMFCLGIDPETKKPLQNPSDYAFFKLNPGDNSANLSSGYLQTLGALSARMRRRFLDGEWADETPNALFSDVDIEKWRHTHGDLPQMLQIIVGVDPSGSGDTDNADNDAIGIVVGGLGSDGNAYLLADYTVKAGPATWGRVATDAYDRHEANEIVGESNYGGAMVEHVIQTARPRTPYSQVVATRGKSVRAEPFSALYEQGKIRHVGNFPDLEDELCAFSTLGYTGAGSPNRADAWIWVLARLFPNMIASRKKEREIPRAGGSGLRSGGTWMGN